MEHFFVVFESNCVSVQQSAMVALNLNNGQRIDANTFYLVVAANLVDCVEKMKGAK